MTGRKTDLAIVGGGLAGGLMALAVQRARPDLAVTLLEAGAEPGGNHRWSWFASDLPDGGEALLAPLRITRWDQGHAVHFPGHARRLGGAYRSLASVDLAAALRRELPPGALRVRAEAVHLDARGVQLASGERIDARAVVDCRGFVASSHLRGGWQVFLGRHMRTVNPHGAGYPVIMDARVRQPGAYRFVYVLPLGAQDIFVEDTYYADSPLLDRRTLGRRLEAYCAAQGWEGDIVGNEAGVLPVITGGSAAAHLPAIGTPGVGLAGARGLFTHPLTSYTLPFAVETALAVAADADLPGEQLAAMLRARGLAHWRRTGFYRLLGRMLFGAALPDRRVRVFERFYRLPEPLIARFYAGRSTLTDQARILAGKPPVPVGRALRALLASGAELAERPLS